MCSSKSSRGGGPWSKGQGDHDGIGGVQNFFVGIIAIHDGKPYEPASIEGQQGVLKCFEHRSCFFFPPIHGNLNGEDILKHQQIPLLPYPQTIPSDALS
jgi:hypothetical protein